MIRQVAQANAMLIVQYAVGSLIPLLLVPHIVKVIGLVEYGHLAVLMAWGTYAATVIQYAFQMTGPKRLATLDIGETPASVFIDIAFAKLLLLFLIVPLLIFFSIFFMSQESASSFAWVLVFAMPIAVGLNSVWFLQAKGYFLEVCVIAILGSMITLFIGFAYINSNNNHAIDFVVLATVFSSIFTGIGTLLLAISLIKREIYEWKLTRAISAMRDGWHLFISQFVSMLYSTSGVLVINYLLDSKAAGAYSVTERVINALLAGALLTHTAAYPRLALAYVNNRTYYWKILKLILMIYLVVTSIIASLVWSFRELVMKFLYNDINNDNEFLLFFGLLWLVLGIFGTTLTGYLTVSGRTREVWPLTLKILFVSVAVGIPGVLISGGAGWLAALVLSQLLVLQTGFKHWRREYVK